MWLCRIISATILPVLKSNSLSHAGPVLDHGRHLSLRAVSGSAFPLQVVRECGLPELRLTTFANQMLSMFSQGTAYTYLREIVVFANWVLQDAVALRQGWGLYGDPREVRSLLHEYLTVAGDCRVAQRPDALGLRVSYVNVTTGTKINVRLLLAALKKMYDILADCGIYPHENPLVHADARRAIAEFRKQQRNAVAAVIGRPPMPPQSGVDVPLSEVRLSENYFRLVNREWQPRAIDDPDFPSQVYSAGKKAGWSLRELCAVRTLFESGARISEVFELTAADWAISSFGAQFSACNKGSHGVRVKTLYVSSPTAKMYRRYFDEFRFRSEVDQPTVARLPAVQRRDAQSLSAIRIFLTNRGTPMTARLFRDHYWTPALRSAGLNADPHQCRHWFVTNALRNIEESAQGEVELVRRKQELIQYMAWRSGERTLHAYEHVQRGQSFARRLHDIHAEMNRRERNLSGGAESSIPDVAPNSGPLLDPELAYLLGEDNDD